MSFIPSWVLWLSPVVIAPLLAVLWTSWTSRPRGPVETKDSVEQYARFRRAIDRPVPAPRRSGRARVRAGR